MTCQNLSHTRGDTLQLPITVKAKTNGVYAPVDITGSSFVMTLKVFKEDTAAVLTLNGTITDAVAGKVTIEGTSSQMNLDLKDYWYDIQWTNSANEVLTLIKGKLTISYDITT